MESFAESVKRFSRDAGPLINKIDTDHNSFLDEFELAAALSDSHLNRDESRILGVIANYRVNRIGTALPDLSVEELDLINKQSLARTDDLKHDHTHLLIGLEAQFDMFDKNRDGVVSKEELNDSKDISALGLSPPKLCNDVEQKLLKDGPFSKEALSNLALETCHIEDASKALKKALTQTYEKDVKTPEKPLPAFVHEANPAQDITPFVGKQGNIGDCYVLSAVSALAKANPEAIRKMIVDNKNGTYSVLFPGEAPIVVPQTTRAEQLTFNGPSREGSWVSVLEKAYGMLIERRNQNFGIPQITLNPGGFEHEVLADFTGKMGESILGPQLSKMAVPELSARFTSLTKAKLPLCCSTNKEDFDPVQANHAYSIIGFDPKGTDGGTLTLRNPWHNDGRRYGHLVSISVKEFKNRFTRLDIGRF